MRIGRGGYRRGQQLLLAIGLEGITQVHLIFRLDQGFWTRLIQLETCVLTLLDLSLSRKEDAVGKQGLQVVEVELDGRLSAQGLIILGLVALVHSV